MQRKEEVSSLLCNRVLITSKGWTAKVDIVPAERPAMVSTSAGERRAWLSGMRGEVVSCHDGGLLEVELKFFEITELFCGLPEVELVWE